MTAPWNNGLPTALFVGGKEYAIRSDYRAVLDIFLALTDPELDSSDKVLASLGIMYVDADTIPVEHLQEAVEKCFWFLRGGEDEPTRRQTQLVSWEQDFNIIAAPISTIVGKDIRGVEYLHWWSFLSAYMSIGDCLFSQVLHVRDLRKRGKPLSKADREFERRNSDLIRIKKPLTSAEEEILKEWM